MRCTRILHVSNTSFTLILDGHIIHAIEHVLKFCNVSLTCQKHIGDVSETINDGFTVLFD